MHYSRQSPFPALLHDRWRLTSSGSTKSTWHITVDISGSGMRYVPGDSLGIFPKNQRSIVDRLLRYFAIDAEMPIVEKKSGRACRAGQWFHESVDLSALSEKLFDAALIHASSPFEAEAARRLVERYYAALPPEASRREHSWFRQIDAPSFFETYLPSGASFSNIVEAFPPILPRLYSIASTPLASPDHIDLVVRQLEYETLFGLKRGLASSYLAVECEPRKTEVNVFIQPAKHFVFPEKAFLERAPLVMVGPGTGVAPFRAFLKHAEALRPDALSAENVWLFFGERHKEHDFLYKDYWLELAQEKRISFDAVFSRDSTEKEYVQHRMWKKKQKLFEWIHYKNGYLYICGDAKCMAKDVEEMLIQIAMSELNFDRPRGEEWLAGFRRSGRYQKDVY